VAVQLLFLKFFIHWGSSEQSI